MRRMRFVALLFALCSVAARGDSGDAATFCGTRPGTFSFHPHTEIGGRHITAHGVLRVLVVFASFPDDETPHPFWPAHQPPLFIDDFLDPDTSTRSQGSFNLTNYFRQMSLGQFHLVGDAIWVESARSQEEYRTGAYWRANRNVLEERVDSLIDFTNYDQWKKLADHSHVNTPDGQVDMVIMVWRTNMWQFYGEASLGYRPGFVLDGKRIEMGFPEYLPSPLGSGVTCQYVYTDAPRQVFQTIVHELGHWLLGGPHPYNNESPHGKHTYWGMLCNGLRASSCANAYERERLGWIVVPEIGPDVEMLLPDFVSGGAACKYRPPEGDAAEFFYFENHQRLSVFDDVSANDADKGIWVLHQQGPYMELDNLKILPADGNWEWNVAGYSSSCFSHLLPVFSRGVPRVHAGHSHRDQIPTPTSLVNWMRVRRDAGGTVHCGAFYAGEKFQGAFHTGISIVFSMYSNPAAATWSGLPTGLCLEVRNDTDGVVTLRRYAQPADAAPARRHLGVHPDSVNVPHGTVSLAWGSQWSNGQPLEPDVQWSELERRFGTGTPWTRVYQGPALSWSDASMTYDSAGTMPVFFRARVRDEQGKYSVWSDTFRTAVNPAHVVHEPPVPARYDVGPNFPNPFNPSTSVSFSVPVASRVQIVILDLLGREIRRCVDAILQPGVHTVVWDGRNAGGGEMSSGVYFCRMTAVTAGVSVTITRKMLMAK